MEQDETIVSHKVVYQPNWVLKTWSAVPGLLYSYFGYRNEDSRRWKTDKCNVNQFMSEFVKF
eukprot:11447773-Heterocapsa_arctica.AAC.1